MRLTASGALVLTLVGCPASRSPDADAGRADASVAAADAPTPDGGGVCCTYSGALGCTRGGDEPGGGWAADLAGCTYTIRAGHRFTVTIDEHGCTRLVDGGVCVPGDDAGVEAGTDCGDLAPAACLGAGCVPVFDDLCCPTCMPDACADCTDLTYHGCSARSVSPCSTLDVCGVAPAWACGSAAPDCGAADVVDEDSCTVTGCVPGYPSGEGEPDPSLATCVPIVAESCTVACRIEAPPCPTRTWPEGDGSCYTGRCIPAFVCGR